MTSQFKHPQGALVLKEAISSHFHAGIFPILEDMGYPESKIENMKKCGSAADIMVVKQCKKCDLTHAFQGTYHCNKRNCTYCSKKRRRRILRDYMPYLEQYEAGNSFKKDCLRFLTINPQNYDNLAVGIQDIYKNLSKFRRRSYIAERIYAGIWVLEATKKNSTWNIHIHMIYYGRKLDNIVRGVCFECGQNRMKFDYNGKPFCGNHKCNSINVMIKKDSRLVREWKKSSKQNVRMHITSINTKAHMLNYMSKYIQYLGKNDGTFESLQSEAEFIYHTDNKRLINKFGEWYRKKVEKAPMICGCCEENLNIFVHSTAIERYIEHMKSKEPPCKPYYLRGIHKDQRFLREHIPVEQAEKEVLDFFDDLHMTLNDLKEL